jgi:hypothetical protein
LAGRGPRIQRFERKELLMLLLLRLLAFLALCLIGIGLYRGWFSFSKPQPDAQANKVDIRVSVDKGKMNADLGKVEKKFNEETKQFESRTNAK